MLVVAVQQDGGNDAEGDQSAAGQVVDEQSETVTPCNLWKDVVRKSK